MKEMESQEPSQVLELATEKGVSIWLTVLPVKGMGFDLHKRQFGDTIMLHYDWLIWWCSMGLWEALFSGPRYDMQMQAIHNSAS